MTAASQRVSPVAWLGRVVLERIRQVGAAVIFAGRSVASFARRRWRLEKLVRAMDELGLRCAAIVLVVGLFTGLVLGLQGYYTLARFGSEGLLGPAVALTLVRELGPVLTALMIVAQAGSALAAELGIQRNSEQIDALVTMNIEPMGYLVGARLLAACLCFPILTTFFDLIGMVGGYLTGVVLLHVDGGLYWRKLMDAVTTTDVRAGYVKALVFGLMTTSICAFQGYFTHRLSREHGARGVSQSATRAVVLSCVLVLIADYLITSFYL